MDHHQQQGRWSQLNSTYNHAQQQSTHNIPYDQSGASNNNGAGGNNGGNSYMARDSNIDRRGHKRDRHHSSSVGSSSSSSSGGSGGGESSSRYDSYRSHHRNSSERHYHRSDRHSSSRRSRSPVSSSAHDGDESPPRQRERKKKRSWFDVTPQAMQELHLQGVTPTSSNLNPTTGNIVVPQPYKNSFGVIVRPNMPGFPPSSSSVSSLFQTTQPMIPTPVVAAAAAAAAASANISAIDKQQRRVYVGNIPKDCTEQEIVMFFNDMLRRGFPDSAPGTDSLVVSTTLNYEKSFAFLDFKSPQDATHAMALDGIKFRDTNILKIRRPKDYKPPPGGDPSLRLDRSRMGNVPGIVSTNVPDGPNKLFIGGLPAHMPEDQVLRFLSSVGPLKAFNLVKDIHTGLSKGYAFCEYLNAKDTDEAIRNMTGVELHGKKLLVQRASVGVRSGEEGDGSSLTNPNQGLMDEPMLKDPEKASVASILNLSTKVETAMANVAQHSDLLVEPTKILVLLNLVTLNDLTRDNVYQEIVQDVHNECNQYGQVLNVRIPRPLPDKDIEDPSQDKGPGVGKVFVEFATAQQAQRAQMALAGRRYQGRLVITTYAIEGEYFSGRY